LKYKAPCTCKSCKYQKECKAKTGIRIKREIDKRIFTQVARESKKYIRLYNKRTSVERVNGRIDRDLCFKNHTIRGLKNECICRDRADNDA